MLRMFDPMDWWPHGKLIYNCMSAGNKSKLCATNSSQQHQLGRINWLQQLVTLFMFFYVWPSMTERRLETAQGIWMKADLGKWPETWEKVRSPLHAGNSTITCTCCPRVLGKIHFVSNSKLAHAIGLDTGGRIISVRPSYARARP